jgi:hypothetical protein
LSVYSRAELRGSDHRPGNLLEFLLTAGLETDPILVFALFRTEVRIVDTVKRAALSRLLLETTLAAVPDEILEEKFAALALPSDKDDCKASYLEFTSSLKRYVTVPAPSSDDLHWWDKLGEYHFGVRFGWLDGEASRNRQGAVSDFASITGGTSRKSLRFTRRFALVIVPIIRRGTLFTCSRPSHTHYT